MWGLELTGGKTGTGPQAIQLGDRTPALSKQGLAGGVVAVKRDRLQVCTGGVRVGQIRLEVGAAPILEAGEITGVLEFRNAKAASSLDPLQRLAALVNQAGFAHATSPNRVESRWLCRRSRRLTQPQALAH